MVDNIVNERFGRLARGLYVSTWGLYLLSIGLMDWSKSSPLSVSIGAFGLLGFAIALFIFKTRRATMIYLCMSAVLVLLYLGKWATQIGDRIAQGAHLDFGVELAQQVQIWIGMVQIRLSDNDILGGFAIGYWQFGMALAQICMIVIIVYLHRTRTDA